MKLNEDKLKKVHGYREGKADALDAGSVAKALAYKKDFLKKFVAISPQQIDARLGDDRYWVTRKYDGEFADIFYDHGITVTVNRSGRVRTGIPCIDEAGELIAKAGFKEAILPAEIYVHDEKKKTRVNDLINALADKEKAKKLRLAVYDITELDGVEYRPANYGETLEKLTAILEGGRLCHVVDHETARSNDEVKEIFARWVETEGSEGLVVRSEMPFVWKVKPRHNVDAVVVGFTEGTGNQKGQVRTMLMALMPEEGKYQIVTKVGGGMPDKLKKELFEYFTPRVMDSEYIATDSNHVAFRMVEPDRVMEFSVNDVRYESPNGMIQNDVLEISEGRYRLASVGDGISFVAPVFERFRDDKRADAGDVRLSQVESFSSFEPDDIVSRPMAVLRDSTLLFREVYLKEQSGKIMVRKFVGWKTNKERSGDYPSYVLHVTDFSTQRQQPLQRDIYITESKKQLQELKNKSIEANIKKGWEKHG